MVEKTFNQKLLFFKFLLPTFFRQNKFEPKDFHRKKYDSYGAFIIGLGPILDILAFLWQCLVIFGYFGPKMPKFYQKNEFAPKFRS